MVNYKKHNFFFRKKVFEIEEDATPVESLLYNKLKTIIFEMVRFLKH